MTRSRMIEHVLLTEDTFFDIFQPIESPEGSHLWADAPAVNVEHLWSVVESDEDSSDLYAVPGFDRRAIGYVACVIAWQYGRDGLDITLEAEWDVYKGPRCPRCNAKLEWVGSCEIEDVCSDCCSPEDHRYYRTEEDD